MRNVTLGNIFDMVVFIAFLILFMWGMDLESRVQLLENAPTAKHECAGNELPADINDLANSVYGVVKALEKLDKEGAK